MATQIEKAHIFRQLHVPGTPLVLCNVWDVGSGKAVAQSGARAIATGSWAVAASQGFEDGEALPIENALGLAQRLASSIDLPVSFDFEGGYARDPDTIRANAARLIKTGVVGLNFEDQVVRGQGLYPVEMQSARIAAVREAACEAGIPIFINARTDVFLKNETGAAHHDLLTEAADRAAAYREAGADGFFVPGLTAPDLVHALCSRVGMPVNIMTGDGFSNVAEIAKLGVARISYGPAPYLDLMEKLQRRSSILANLQLADRSSITAA